MFTENKSHKIPKALHQRFLDRTSKLAYRKCHGYDCAAKGFLLVNQKEAGVAGWMFESYCNGASFGKIAKELRNVHLCLARQTTIHLQNLQGTERDDAHVIVVSIHSGKA